MKKLCLLAGLLLLMPLVLRAQLQKNNVLLEGSFAYSRSTPKYGTGSQPGGQHVLMPMDIVSQKLLLSPTAGFFITERLLLSLGIIYNSSSSKEAYAGVSPAPGSGFQTTYTRFNSNSRSHDVAPVLSLRYFHPLSDKLYFSARLSEAYHFTSTSMESSYSVATQNESDPLFNELSTFSLKYNGTKLSMSLTPHLVYFVNRHLALDAQVGALTFVTAQMDSRFPGDQKPAGNGLDLALSPAAWQFAILFNLGGDKY